MRVRVAEVVPELVRCDEELVRAVHPGPRRVAADVAETPPAARANLREHEDTPRIGADVDATVAAAVSAFDAIVL